MIFPADLPPILQYRVGFTVRMTLPRRPVHYIGSGGCTDASQVCPRIPHGCTGWRHAGETEWRELNTLPQAWMPFLNRERNSEMDARPEEKG